MLPLSCPLHIPLRAPLRVPLRAPLRVPLRAPLRVPLRAPLRAPRKGVRWDVEIDEVRRVPAAVAGGAPKAAGAKKEPQLRLDTPISLNPKTLNPKP